MTRSKIFILIAIFYIVSSVTLGGCSATTHIAISNPKPEEIYDKKKYAQVKLYYATDRSLVFASGSRNIIFGSGRNEDITYGTCQIYVPKEAPKVMKWNTIWRFDFMEDATHNMFIASTSVAGKESFFSDLSSAVDQTPDKKLFIFIHGYNMKFENVARRTAQIAYQIGEDIIPVFYSWPSMGTLWGYLADENNVEWTRPHLQQFLEDIATRSHAKTIYLMAHSMGNRVLSNALMISTPNQKSFMEHKELISSIIMAAPDVDEDIFRRDIAPVLKLTGASITIYASSNDTALKASENLHDNHRIGEINGGLPFVIDGIDTIDVSEIDDSFTGHGYYFNSSSILLDIEIMLKGHLPPALRPHLKLIDLKNSPRYWKMTP